MSHDIRELCQISQENYRVSWFLEKSPDSRKNFVLLLKQALLELSKGTYKTMQYSQGVQMSHYTMLYKLNGKCTHQAFFVLWAFKKKQ